MDTTPRAVPISGQTPVDLIDQIASLVESTAALQRATAQLLSQLPPELIAGGAVKFARPYNSHIESNTPQSAMPSTLAPGVPIPSRGWQQDHSPKAKIIASTKTRLIKDGWEDCEDTDIHAARLSEAMLRLGMEDMDNFTTEASRLNCSNMAITATLISAIVATFSAGTYDQKDMLYMRVVNGLWFLSLLMSLATATLCMLGMNFHLDLADSTLYLGSMTVSEWLTWSTSQELRDHSMLYRLGRTAFRSAIMHLTIFLFFAGLMVLMWNESPWTVCIVPSIICALFAIYYIIATVRAPFLAFFGGVRQFDTHDFRGLRVQVWTPFTLSVHHTFNYIFILVVNPIRRLIRGSIPIKKSKKSQVERPTLQTDAPDKTSSKEEHVSCHKTPQVSVVYSDPEALSPESTHPLSTSEPHDHPLPPPDTKTEYASLPQSRFPLSGPPPPPMNHTETGDTNQEDAEFRRKLRATRMRRVTEQEVIGAGRTRRRTIDV